MLWAQSAGISGRVLDETGQPIIGAAVSVKGTTMGITTGLDGSFRLNFEGNAILVVSFLGYETQQVSVLSGRPTDIVLKNDATDIEAVEVVSVGYGVQKKESVVGAISSVRPSDLQVPVRSLSQSLAGNVTGIVALQTSGEPGKDDAQFWIRGIATFTGDPNPLILVDGIERPLNNVDPLEIESFSVLRDASATAVYGVRGANGVILINTRKGFDGPAKIDIRYEQGFSFPSKRLSFVDAATRSELFNEAIDATPGASQALKYRPDEIAAMRSQRDPFLYPDVDWQELLMRNVSLSEKVSANISGGGKFARYFTALSFYNQEGQYNMNPGKYSWVSGDIGRFGANVNYKRYNFRTNVDMDITKTTVVSLGLQGNVTENLEPVNGSAAIYRDIINAAPNAFPIILPDGRLTGVDGLNNPYNMLTQHGYAKTTGNTLRANLSINQDFSFITKGLSAKVVYAYDFTNTNEEKRKREINFFQVTGRDESGDLELTEWQADNKRDYLGYEQVGTGTRDQYFEASVTYDRQFGRHEVGALVMGYFKDNRTLSNSLSYIAALPHRSVGMAGRVTYAYDKRYLVEANIGFNGSENFAKGHRMGVFPSFALGWVASEEAFLRNNDVLTWLKIRASVGQVGNDQIYSQRFIY
ncbi:MAG: SusC/RagA family TonB-linked outer membrane protein, partial [Alistipes sp.]|nr:SusC/RagA family TonB-linked outer membrane protein [Alistipes sp.]